MLLKNYYKLLSAQMSGTSGKTNVIMVDTSGSTVYAYRTYPETEANQEKLVSSFGFWGLYNAAETSYTERSVIFGTGTTPPTIDDFKLSGSIITGISTTVNSTFTVDENGVSITATYTITNNNASEITVGEVAYVGGYNSASGCTSMKAVLFERTVLETPITIPAGDVGQVTYTIRMNYPTA